MNASLKDEAVVDARLKWQCRRGMLELDLLLSGFLANGYAQLDEQQQQLFVSLLETPDTELLEYLMGRNVHREAHIQNVINKTCLTARI